MQQNQTQKLYTIKEIAKRIIPIVKKFKGLYSLSIVLNIVFSVLSVISIAIIKIVFQIIFPDPVSTERATNQSVGFLEGLKEHFFGFISSIIISGPDRNAHLIRLGLFVIFIFIIKNIFKYWSSIATLLFEESFIKHVRDKLFEKLQALPVEYFSKSKQGNIISIVTNDVGILNATTVSPITGIIRESVQMLLFLALLISLSPLLSLISFSTSIISLVIVKYGMAYLRRYATRMQAAMADFTTTLQESLSGIRVIRAYNAQKMVNNKFKKDTAYYVRSSIKYQKIIALIPSSNEILAICALSVVLYVGGSQVISGTMKSGDLMTFLFSLFAIMSPITTTLHNFSQLQRGMVASERIFTVLDTESVIVNGDKKIEKFDHEIEVKGLTFSYDKEHQVLKNVNFKISKGKKIALVGASGSGKSTMLDLLIRFYDPVQGEITIDGINLKELDTESYRNLFGIVSQESVLFNDSLSNNITFGSEDIRDDMILNSAKIANAFDFINKMPQRFQTYIGDRGALLSGGEKQRISIARAVVRDPEILVFDEATSSLDVESERIVQEAINHTLRNRTAIIVAHRLSTIVDCDEILVFDQGELIERGSHKQLIEINGVYKRLCDIQFKAAISDKIS
ncbi:MAG: ABC transporter ATP-binding protein [Candidatus Kapabacteria bacterium]|nr:ABC transporter ATP-binding protein [Candidatus Kapabacteria bacterium]